MEISNSGTIGRHFEERGDEEGKQRKCCFQVKLISGSCKISNSSLESFVTSRYMQLFMQS